MMTDQEESQRTQKREQYYEYFYQICSEIDEFIDRKNGPLSHTKKDEMFQLMVEKTLPPLVYWKPELTPEQSDSERTNTLTEGQINHLKALSRKFDLKEENGRYATTHPLSSGEYIKLKESMIGIGFKYDTKTKTFVGEVKH